MFSKKKRPAQRRTATTHIRRQATLYVFVNCPPPAQRHTDDPNPETSNFVCFFNFPHPERRRTENLRRQATLCCFSTFHALHARRRADDPPETNNFVCVFQLSTPNTTTHRRPTSGDKQLCKYFSKSSTSHTQQDNASTTHVRSQATLYMFCNFPPR